MQNFEVVNLSICAIFTPCHCKIRPPRAELIILPKNFILKYFQKLIPFQLLLDQDKFMGQV